MATPSRQVIDVSGATFLRAIAAVALVWIWLQIWQWILVFIVGVFLAIVLDPLVEWLEGRRVRRAYGSPLVTLVLAALVVWFIYVTGATLLEEGRLLSDRLDELQAAIAARVPPGLVNLLPRSAGDTSLGSYVAGLGRAIVSGLVSVAVALILTVYLLLDGRRTYEWLAAFVPERKRARFHVTAEEARQAILAYMKGNFFTSVLCSVCTWIVLVLLDVPAALLLALLAGVCDLIPVLGIVISAVPMILLALTVSIWAGVAVTAFNVIYNIVENYYITPKVYGHQLQLSDLAVIVSFALGAELGGVVGALIALPLAAVYPVVEEKWLRGRLGDEVVQEHRRIEHTAEH